MRQFQSKPSGSVPQGKTGSMRLIYRGILPAVLGLYKGRPRGVRAERFEGVIGGSPVPHCRPGPPIVRFRGDLAGGLATAVQGSIRLHHHAVHRAMILSPP